MSLITQSSHGASPDSVQSSLDKRPRVDGKALRSALGGWKGTEGWKLLLVCNYI